MALRVRSRGPVARRHRDAAGAQTRHSCGNCRSRPAALAAQDLDAFSALPTEDYVNHQVSAAGAAPARRDQPKQGLGRFFGARL